MRVAILGCGYLGRRLGRELQTVGHDVVGVRRSRSGLRSVESAGLSAVEADVTDASTLDGVPSVDVLVYSASPDGRDIGSAREVYGTGLRTVIDHFAGRETPPDRLVYTSSTGVYGDHGGKWVDESTPIDPVGDRGAVLAAAESLASAAPFDTTIVRLAGLYGPDRYRIDRYLDGPVTAGILNMIHRDDAAGAIGYLVRNELALNETVLAVDDEPVSKWVFADWLADRAGRGPPPKWTVERRLAANELDAAAAERIRADKRCSNEKLRALGYELTYPTFRHGYRPVFGIRGCDE